MAYRSAPVVAEFRVGWSSGLAGGPIEVELAVVVHDERPRFLLVSGDRHAYLVSGTVGGVVLVDPDPGYFYSGPCWPAEITRERPFVAQILVADYLALEDAIDRIAPGQTASLGLTLERRAGLAESAEEAFSARGSPISGELSLVLRRDDAALAHLVDDLVDRVRRGPLVARERWLGHLLSLRAPYALARVRGLVDHPDPLVASRVHSHLEYRGG